MGEIRLDILSIRKIKDLIQNSWKNVCYARIERLNSFWTRYMHYRITVLISDTKKHPNYLIIFLFTFPRIKFRNFRDFQHVKLLGWMTSCILPTSQFISYIIKGRSQWRIQKFFQLAQG